MGEDKAVCMGCGNFFEAKQLKKIGKKNYCKECLEEMLTKNEEEKESSSKNQPTTQIIIQQQQQQQQQAAAPSSDKPKGSGFWLCFWIIVFFPIAIWYYITHKWD